MLSAAHSIRTPSLSDLTTSSLLHRCSSIRDALTQAGLFSTRSEPHAAHGTSGLSAANSWRIGIKPFALTPQQLRFFQHLGGKLLAFYRGLNRLYHDSARGTQPAWVAGYLDQGKPEALVAYGRMNRFRDHLPAVIRPDVIPTQDGMVITELDSVPGGIGLTAHLTQVYHDLSEPPVELVGGRDGMVRGFAAMLEYQKGRHDGCVAVIVSDEAKDYRPEMSWMTSQLRTAGLEAYCVDPREIRFTEERLLIARPDRNIPIGLVYRFYELFDLPNIPKAELIQYAVKKQQVAVTPPYKPALEEKSAFALLHHPALQPFWRADLGEETLVQLLAVMPRTWILDPAPVPPSAAIPGLSVGGRAVMNWRDLAGATQKERHFVIKPSGFSELAWGSRGVSVGHDLPQGEWAAAIEYALTSFVRTPYVLQEFHKGRQFQLEYFDPETGALKQMSGRTRLSPFYFVSGATAELAGILATVCPADKKILHGMKDAVLVPCAIAHEAIANVE